MTEEEIDEFQSSLVTTNSKLKNTEGQEVIVLCVALEEMKMDSEVKGSVETYREVGFHYRIQLSVWPRNSAFLCKNQKKKLESIGSNANHAD